MGGEWERILVKEPKERGNLVSQDVDERIMFEYS
jgi:hypothetical protein